MVYAKFNNPEYERLDDLVTRYETGFQDTLSFLNLQKEVIVKDLDVEEIILMYDMMEKHEEHKSEMSWRVRRNYSRARRVFKKSIKVVFGKLEKGETGEVVKNYEKLLGVFEGVGLKVHVGKFKEENYVQSDDYQVELDRDNEMDSLECLKGMEVGGNHYLYKAVQALLGREGSDFNYRFDRAVEYVGCMGKVSGEDRERVGEVGRVVVSGYENGVFRRKIDSGELEPEKVENLIIELGKK